MLSLRIAVLLALTTNWITEVQAREDVTPPIIESVQLVPEKIEIGGENSTLFVSVTVSDESDIDWAASDLWLVEPGNNFRFINFEQESSDPKVGKIELKFTSNDPSGDWEIRRVRVKDIYNQGREIQANSANPVDPLQKSLSELGVPETLTVSGGRDDTTPPYIESVQFVPEKIEIGGENSTLFVSVTVSDESDIDWAASDLWLVEPGNNFRFINFEQESSDPKVGKIELKFTSNDPSGDWEIRRVRVKDIYNQGREIQANSANPVDPLQKSLSELGVPETLTVSGGRDDTTPPYIESVQFVPEKIEIGGENSTLFVSVTVSDESDIDWAASDLWLVEPGNNFRFINFEQESSDPKVGKIELKFTSNDPSGDWEIRRVRVKDIYNQGREIQANSANPVDPLQKSLSELGVAQLLSIAVADTDGDGTNNIEDIDDDDDGVVDANDAFPLDANESKDTDNDGTGNNADEDDDGDGISDSQEIADDTDPLNRNSCATCFSLDVDSNGEISALTDGLLIIRHMFGFTGESLTAGALTSDSPITSPDEITQSLTDAKVLDVDDDGEIKALTDGLLAIRYLFGFTGESLTANAVGANALRADAEEIISYLGKFRSVKFNSKKLVIATGASVSIVNSVAQNGSQFSMQIINYTDFDVELVKFTQESDAGQVLLSKTDPDLLGGDMLLEPSESTTITLTIGAFGQSLPFTTNFYYINPETKKEEKKSYEWKVQ